MCVFVCFVLALPCLYASSSFSPDYSRCVYVFCVFMLMCFYVHVCVCMLLSPAADGRSTPSGSRGVGQPGRGSLPRQCCATARCPHLVPMCFKTNKHQSSSYISISADRTHGFDPASEFLSKIGLLYHFMTKETYFQRKNPWQFLSRNFYLLRCHCSSGRY
jgi:hypothetical protein